MSPMRLMGFSLKGMGRYCDGQNIESVVNNNSCNNVRSGTLS